MSEPLEYLNRKELQLGIMRNLEREVKKLHRNNAFRWEWDRSPNWKKVQRYLNGNTSKAGSTSSTEQCMFLGVHPDGMSFYDMLKETSVFFEPKKEEL